jgi:hypothetical protein
MPTPTQSAEQYFRIAHDRAIWAANHTAEVNDPTGIAVYDIAACLSAISKGLGDLAVGLRATYMRLESLENKLDQQRLSAR